MTTLAYIACAGSGTIAVLSVDEHSGHLAQVQQVDLGGLLMPMTLAPDRRHLHVARRSAPLAVATLSIDPSTGWLEPVGEAPLPHSMAYLSTDATGRHLFSASYGGNLVAVSPIDASGLPGPASQILPTAANAHCIVQALDRRHVYSTCLGGGTLLHWLFDGASGELRLATPAQIELPQGSGPRHLVFHPNGRMVYLLGELDGSVALLDIAPESGDLAVRATLSALPPGFAGAPWASDLHLTPDARFLYVSERRSNTLAIFSLDAVDGSLTLTGHADTEAQPRGFAITPSGRFLLAAGQLSGRVTCYAIDKRNGKLTPCDSLAVGDDPNWIECLSLP